MKPAPKRIQRRRTKGWKMPRNTISVARPGPFGNPYKGPGAVTAFRTMVEQMQKALHGEGGLLPVCGPDHEMIDPRRWATTDTTTPRRRLLNGGSDD